MSEPGKGIHHRDTEVAARRSRNQTLEVLERRGSGELCKPLTQRYYCSVSESEFATDVCFKNAASLAKFYPQFLHHGIRSFSSADVFRFLGKRAGNLASTGYATAICRNSSALAEPMLKNGLSAPQFLLASSPCCALMA